MSRRRQRSTGGRLLIWAFVLGLLVAAMMYLRCGEGFGFGPGGGGDGEESEKGEAARDEVRPAVGGQPAGRCQLRVDASGVTLDGKPAEVDAAVAACKKAGGAELTATGDATYGTVEALRSALDREGVPLLVRDPATAPRPSP